MPSVLVSTSHGAGAPALAADLEIAGFTPLPLSERLDFVQDVIKREADIIVCFELVPDPDFFASLADLGRLAPRPVVVFTTDTDAEKIALATRSDIHAYVVGGYGRDRLRPVIQLAQARFRQDRAVRQELADVTQRFSERKLVDRAKGILMGAHQLREDEAFRALRSAAMASKQRIGQISQTLINSATFGEAMNRAGQLRMLSQRLVKLYALGCTGSVPERGPALIADSIARFAHNLATLDRILSKPTLGDLIEPLSAPWAGLRAALLAPPLVRRLSEVDALAEAVLLRAERLTTNLEVATFATVLRVINIAGRQRMLSQRMAKEALIRALIGNPPAAEPVTQPAGVVAQAEFIQGLAYLETLPMSNDRVIAELADANAVWKSFLLSLDQAGSAAGRAGIFMLSEQLLEHSDRLTDELERAMQTLVG